MSMYKRNFFDKNEKKFDKYTEIWEKVSNIIKNTENLYSEQK